MLPLIRFLLRLQDLFPLINYDPEIVGSKSKSGIIMVPHLGLLSSKNE